MVAVTLTWSTSYRIIKRRIAWLIGRWVASQCASPRNQDVWAVLVHLLAERGPSSDVVVRLTTAAAIRDCVDVSAHYDFSPWAQPYADR